MNWTDKINVTNEDCMDLMQRYPDNYFDLAIVDPPYGIKRDGHNGTNCKNQKHNWKKHDFKKWDNTTPKSQYFNELFRVSKNQIIWGANYFVEYLNTPKMGWIFWYKGQNELSMSDGEIAYSSFNKATRQININRGFITKHGGSIHPTQKPIKLYEWLLTNYTKEGDKILDTHLGSGGHAIACHNLGFELTACELDSDYYKASLERFKLVTSQLRIEI